MSDGSESITLKLPRSALPDVIAMSDALIDRMHELLERNTDRQLSPLEHVEAEMLVELAQFSQIVALSMQAGKGAA